MDPLQKTYTIQQSYRNRLTEHYGNKTNKLQLNSFPAMQNTSMRTVPMEN